MFERTKHFLTHRSGLAKAMTVMSPGHGSPYLTAINRSQRNKYVAPENPDDVEGHLQTGVYVQFKDGKMFVMTDTGSIHVSSGDAHWMKNSILREKSDEIVAVISLTKEGLVARWGNPAELPPADEIKED